MTTPTPGFIIGAYHINFKGAVRLVVTVPDRTTAVRIERSVGNAAWEPVRAANPVATLTGTGTAVDTEFPFGVDVRYRAVAVAPASGATSNVVVWNDPGDPCSMNMSDPVLPVLSQWFEVTGRESLTSTARGESVDIIGRREPVAVTDVRGGFAGMTQIVAREYGTVLAARDLVRSGRPLVLRYPADWNEPVIYASVGSVVETRVRPQKGNVAYRLIELEWVEVAAPRGTVRQFLGDTYETLRDYQPNSGTAPITYRDLADHVPTYLDLVVTGPDW